MGLLMFDASYNQIWGTFLGGASSEEGFTCVFDQNDNLFFAGGTDGAEPGILINLPGAYNQSTYGGGSEDVLMGKFNSNGQLVWCSLFGGDGNDAQRGQMGFPAQLLIQPTTGELIMGFNTFSTNLPIVNLPGAYNKTVPTNSNYGPSGSGSFWNYAGYICKFSTSCALNYATYYYTQDGGGDLIENMVYGGCDKLYIGSVGDSQKQLSGASSGYNLLNATGSGRDGYITMFDRNTYAFQWDSYIDSNIAGDCIVAANIAQARFYALVP
ncbi:MAG TPA: hypothetical protein VFQ86_10715, partial [Arachidicoccus soli]|nr:hypothetical protein [Arachidicoccus soli]